MDLFESAHDLEEQHIDEGFEEGQRDGKLAGMLEGRELGVNKGFEIGLEVGYYAGCVQIWRSLLEQQQTQQGSPQEPGSEPPSAAAASVESPQQTATTAPQPASPSANATDSTTPGSSSAGGHLVPVRLKRSIRQLEELLATYPLYDPQDERLQDLLEALRGRFKALTASLGFAAEYGVGARASAPISSPGGPSSTPEATLSF